MKRQIEKKYTDSLYYEVFLTAKYIKKTAEQHFKHLRLELTLEEFSTLDFLYDNNNICQRDLAVRMLINRANMGKILNGLEENGYITRTLDVRENRPVKIVALSDKGEEIYTKTLETLKANTKPVSDKISKEECDTIIQSLQKIRAITKEILEINI